MSLVDGNVYGTITKSVKADRFGHHVEFSYCHYCGAVVIDRVLHSTGCSKLQAAKVDERDAERERLKRYWNEIKSRIPELDDLSDRARRSNMLPTHVMIPKRLEDVSKPGIYGTTLLGLPIMWVDGEQWGLAYAVVS